MSTEALIVLAALAVIIILLVLLLLRRDPGVAMLQAAQERQGERLGALTGDTRAALATASEETGKVISGFAVEQTRQLLQTQSALQAATAALTAKLEKMQGDASEVQRTGFNTAREAQAETAATLRRDLAGGIGEINTNFEKLRTGIVEAQALAQRTLAAEFNTTRDLLEAKLKEMREGNDARLAEIQKSVNEQLASAVEKQMNESFQRVIDQFAAIQQMMGNVQSVATQVGDLKRLFGNIKTRGGWGEAQLKAMLDDFLPAGAYETNVKLREDSNDVVEFAILMPGGEDRARLPLDAKFPSEDYERLMTAHEAGDLAAEVQARRAIEMRVRGEAAKIAQKYICPPRSTEYAILFLPTEGLYAEVSRIPGLIDDVARASRVFIAGPSLLPAMLKTIQLGYVSFALSKNAESVRELLSATKTEMAKMDTVLEKLGKQVGGVSNTLGNARIRTKAIARKLRGLEALPGETAERLLEIEAGMDEVTAEGDED